MLPEHKAFIHKGVEAGMRFSMSIPSGTFEGGLGVKLGAHSGNSLEFMEHRNYIAGDDLRQMDWNVYARTDKLTIKLYREEVNPTLDIVIDGSQSMHLEDSQKSNASVGLASLLATAGTNAGFSYKSWISKDKGFQPLINGNNSPDLWDGLDFNCKTNPSDSIERANPLFQRHGVRILISDLLWLGNPHDFLSKFSFGATAVIIIQVLAEKDIQPQIEGNIRLIDSETEEVQEIFMDQNAVRAYKDRFSRHQETWSASCREAGTIFTCVNAEQVIDNWILEDLINHEILRIH